MRPVFLSTALVLAVMASPAAADRSRGGHAKPTAPVTLTLTPRPADGVVVLDAVVTRDVPTLELRIGTEVARFGATRAGQRRRLAARIAAPATGGLDVVGSARVAGRNRVVSLRLGTAAVEKARPVELRTVAGRTVAEVRE